MATPVAKIELGLGGSLYGTLMNESSLVGLWPLDRYDGTAKDVNSGGRDLSPIGGITGLQTGPLPEGGLASSFSSGVMSRSDSSLRPTNVTCVAVFNASSTTPAQCVMGAATLTGHDDGYFLKISAGVISMQIRTADAVGLGTGVALSSGTWYVVIGRYDGTTIKIALTNLATGVTTTASQALAGSIFYSGSTTFRLGDNDQRTAPYAGYIAAAAVCSSAISDASVTAIQATTQWTDVTADVRCNVDPLRATYGIQGNGALDRVASVGTMSFVLDDSTANSGAKLGYYSPGHANCRSGFRVGIPARLSITYNGTTYRKWVGAIDTIAPRPGKKLARATEVNCVDWFAHPSAIPFNGIPAVANRQSSTAVVMALLPLSGHTPNAGSFVGAGDTFEYVFDNTGQGTPVLAELARLTLSEFGALYIKGDTNFGNQLVLEARSVRETQTSNHFNFIEDDTLDLQHAYDASLSYDIVRTTVTPRLVDAAATTVLYTLQGTQQLGAGESVTIEAAYRDPSQQAAKVGGISMVTPVATTDYTMNTAANGGGTDLTANLSVTFSGSNPGGSSATLIVTNTGGSVGYITKLQLRGKGIYTYNPFTVERTNRTKIATRGPRVLEFEMPYQSNISTGQSIANILLTAFDGAPPFVTSVTFEVKRSSLTVGANILSVEPGHRVGLSETVTGLDGTSGRYVQNVEIRIEKGSVMFFTFGLAPALAAGNFWLLDTAGASELDSTTIPGY
jgi:hypothetical protein